MTRQGSVEQDMACTFSSRAMAGSSKAPAASALPRCEACTHVETPFVGAAA